MLKQSNNYSAKKQRKQSKTRVLVFGTFDVLHPGHINFFTQARKLAKNSVLIVSVARGKNVEKIKGKNPLYSENERLKKIKKAGLADKVVLGAVKDYLGHIAALKPQVIALGYDQKAYTRGLKSKLKKIGLRVKIARLKPFFAHRYKTSLMSPITRKPKNYGKAVER